MNVKIDSGQRYDRCFNYPKLYGKFRIVNLKAIKNIYLYNYKAINVDK